MWKAFKIGLIMISFATSLLAQDTPSDGQFVEVNSADVYYIEQGPAEGEPVILLHGFGGSTFTWRHTMPALAEVGLRVIAYDRPPFGRSGKDPELDFSLSAQTDLLAPLMDSLNIERASLVGHSAGGAVIANFALHYPERVDKLVFVDGAVGMTEEDSDDSGMSSLFTFVSSLDPASPFAQAALRAFLTPERFTDMLASAYYNPDVVTPEFEVGYQAPLRVEGWEVGLLAFMRDSSSEESAFEVGDLAAIEAPVLLIWGEEDTWVPISVGERLRDIFPQPTWISYPAVGHLPMEELPEEFNRDLVGFLVAP